MGKLNKDFAKKDMCNWYPRETVLRTIHCVEC